MPRKILPILPQLEAMMDSHKFSDDDRNVVRWVGQLMGVIYTEELIGKIIEEQHNPQLELT